MSKGTPAYLEIGTKRVFACTLDWPGWCRSGKNEEQALQALAEYGPRYAKVCEKAGIEFPPVESGSFDVVERLKGSGTTDFGAPGEKPRSDFEPLSTKQAQRMATLVEASWTTFDRVVAGAPPTLRKGPRGGGRDRDDIVRHVLGAETAYARTLGVRLKEPALRDASAVSELRRAILDVVGRSSDGKPPVEKGWPPRYAARRIAWHVLDHAWEIEDKS